MEISTLLAAWPISAPWQLEPATGGVNNETCFVQARSGRYILRLYGADRHPGKIRYELDILSALGAAALSFAVPAPIPTRSGDQLVVIPGPEGERYATLTPFIPGGRPDKENLAQIYAAGAALGELTAAMRCISVTGDPAVVGRYGDLTHAGLPDPLVGLDQVPMADVERARIGDLLRTVKAELPAAERCLPQQPMHGDYVSVNLLMVGDRVTGVLDFEYACHEFRVFDLAMALWGWTWGLWGSGREWPILEQFARGYLSRQPLSRAELEALPFLIRLRTAGIFIHWAGRYLNGHASEELLRFGVESPLQAEDWLRVNEAELVRRMLTWAESAQSA